MTRPFPAEACAHDRLTRGGGVHVAPPLGLMEWEALLGGDGLKDELPVGGRSGE